MDNRLKDKRIKGDALEMIMRDVLDGMVEFTRETCVGSKTTGMEILAVEKPARRYAAVIPFPLTDDPDK